MEVIKTMIVYTGITHYKKKLISTLYFLENNLILQEINGYSVNFIENEEVQRLIELTKKEGLC